MSVEFVDSTTNDQGGIENGFLDSARDWRLPPEALVPTIRLNWHKRVLANGLTVIVHPDPRTAMVHVDLGYRAGAMDEPAGQTGLSHLFEHLMFTGTTRFPGNYNTRMLEAGAVMVNATTSYDKTHYIQTAPAMMLDFILEAEADRMANFVSSLDEEKLEQQRRVVLEEKRELEGKPLGMVNIWLGESLFRPGHPRRHPVIGHAADVEALTLEQAKAWGAAQYVPANAVLVIAGDIEPEQGFAAAERHFGAIPGGTRQMLRTSCVEPAPWNQMRVTAAIDAKAMGYVAWTGPSPCVAPREHIALSLLGQMFGGDKGSVLHRHFVEERRMATSASVAFRSGRGVSEFLISMSLTAVPEEEPGAAVQALLADFLAAPADLEQLEAVKVGELARRAAALTTYGRRAATLMDGEMLHGNPGWFAEAAQILETLSAEEIWETGRRWLGRPGASILVEQAPARAAPATAVPAPAVAAYDLSSIRPRMPVWQAARLSSGARVLVSHRPDDPQFVLRAVAGNSGLAAEPEGMEGLATLAASYLFVGVGPHDPAQLGKRLSRAGLSANASAQLHTLHLDLHGPAAAFRAAVAVLADTILAPRYESDAFVQRRASLATVAAARNAAVRQRADRARFAGLLGAGHRLARPGLAHDDLVARVDAAQVAAFHRQAYGNAANTVFYLAGNITLEDAVTTLEAGLAGWQGSEPAGLVSDPAPIVPAGGLHVFGLAGAGSAELAARWLVPTRPDEDDALLDICHNVLCGDFRSRSNQFLREQQGWSYGVMGRAFNLRPKEGPRVNALDCAVRAAHAGDSIAAVKGMVAALRSDAPPSAAEIESYRRKHLLELARMDETPFGAVDTIQSLDQQGKDAADVERYCAALARLDTATVAGAAQWALPEPDAILWTAVGDLATMQPGIEAAGLAFTVAEAG
jgi:zinc protease